MAANLTPQYLEAEADYKKAQTAEERLACLKKMYSLLPKHKASEKLQADLKTKISEAKDEVERDKKHPKKTGVSYKILKQGAGQYVILGAPNVGKSRLLTRLTRAAPEVAPYPFTTHEPHAGMMDWEDVRVQLIDTPPITADYLEGYLPGMIQSADAALLLVDLGDDDGPFAAETVIERLAKTKTNLVGDPNNKEASDVERGRGGEQTSQLASSPLPPLAHSQAQPAAFKTKSLVLGNKVDLPGAADRLEIDDVTAALEEIGTLLELKGENPFRCNAYHNAARAVQQIQGDLREVISSGQLGEVRGIGSTLVEMAALVHRDFTQGLKSARIWGTGVYDGQSVKRDHVLHDKDIVELHL